MSQDPDISIIVTAYNSENTLPRLLQSMKSQTYENYEVILINDGSLDGTGAICDEIAKNDKRFKLIHQKNMGVSISRQRGLETCTGKYVIHFDADDWIESCLLEKMYSTIERENADLLVCDYYVHHAAESSYCSQNCAGKSASEVLRLILEGQLHGSLCNKMVRRDALLNCYFTPGINYCEDVLLWTQVLRKPIRIIYLSDAFYHYDYTANSESLTKLTDESFSKHRLAYVNRLEEFLPEHAYKDVIRGIKLGLRLEAFQWDIPEFVSQNFKDTNPYIMSMGTSLYNRVCLYLSAHRLHCLGRLFYSFKKLIRNTIK